MWMSPRLRRAQNVQNQVHVLFERSYTVCLIINEILGNEYHDSAHLVQIRCRGNFYPSFCEANFMKNFIYTHVSYLHPEFVLRNSNVCLYSTSSTMAMFAVTKHSVDIFNFNK